MSRWIVLLLITCMVASGCASTGTPRQQAVNVHVTLKARDVSVKDNPFTGDANVGVTYSASW